jgi:hypothetical protein
MSAGIINGVKESLHIKQGDPLALNLNQLALAWSNFIRLGYFSGMTDPLAGKCEGKFCAMKSAMATKSVKTILWR